MNVMLAAAVTFILVLDPLGNVPMFLAALRTTAPERRQWVILRECLIALALMIGFLFLGKSMLDLLHIDNNSLLAAGGVILMLIAIRMVFPTPQHNLQEPSLHDEPFIVPLAVPYIAGPSMLAVIVVFVSQDPGNSLWYLGGLVIAWFFTTVTLYFAGFLQRVLGERTLIAVERLMGMILVILAVQMMFDGTKAFFLQS